VACRFTEQDAKARLHTQVSPVTIGKNAQFGIAFKHQCGPLNWTELSKPLALFPGTVDQTRIELGWDLDRVDARGVDRARVHGYD
jgi:hypothetical protein